MYHRLKCVSGTNLCESEMCYLCVKIVHRAKCNIISAQSTGVYVVRNPVVEKYVNVVVVEHGIGSRDSTCNDVGHTLT